MRSSPNQAVAARFWEEVYGSGNVDLLDELVSPRFVFHDLALKKRLDADSLRYLIENLCNDIPGFAVVIGDQFSAGSNRVVTELTFRADAADPGDDGTVEFSAIAISRLSRRRITNVRLLWESLRAEQELEPPIRGPRWKWPPWG